MKKRIIVSYISVIDVEIFSCIENYIAYVGYPWQYVIDDKEVFEDDGSLLKFYIGDRYDMQYIRDGSDITKMKNSMMKYISCFGLHIDCKSEYAAEELIDCIVNFRGVTY